MEDVAKKGGWGGARQGSGRKPLNHGKAVVFYPTREVEEALGRVAESRTAFINEAVADYARRKGMI